MDPLFYWWDPGTCLLTALEVTAHWPSPVQSVINTSTTISVGAEQGCQTGKSFRSGLLSDLKENTGPLHLTCHLDPKYFIDAATAAGPTWSASVMRPHP